MDGNIKNSNTLVICGKRNVGKTTSLVLFMNDVIEHFKDLGATIDGPHMWGTGEDCWVRIIYNGTTIGINTRGDGGYWIKRGLDLLGICDYYILASHLYGETIDAILEQKESYGMSNIIFVNKVGLHGNSVNGNEDLVKEINDDNLEFNNQLLNIFYNSILSGNR